MSAGNGRGSTPVRLQTERGPVNKSRTAKPRAAKKPERMTVKKALAKLHATEGRLQELEAVVPTRRVLAAAKQERTFGLRPCIHVMAGRRSWSIEDDADGGHWAAAIRLAQEVGNNDRNVPVYVRIPAAALRTPRTGFSSTVLCVETYRG